MDSVLSLLVSSVIQCLFPMLECEFLEGKKYIYIYVFFFYLFSEATQGAYHTVCTQ